MEPKMRKLMVYTVVEVWRGIAAGASSFARLRDAEDYAQRVRRRHNLLEDDVKLFRSSVRIPPRRQHASTSVKVHN
jgi:hypothetical protein